MIGFLLFLAAVFIHGVIMSTDINQETETHLSEQKRDENLKCVTIDDCLRMCKMTEYSFYGDYATCTNMCRTSLRQACLYFASRVGFVKAMNRLSGQHRWRYRRCNILLMISSTYKVDLKLTIVIINKCLFWHFPVIIKLWLVSGSWIKVIGINFGVL